jgi:hypothetical protein
MVMAGHAVVAHRRRTSGTLIAVLVLAWGGGGTAADAAGPADGQDADVAIHFEMPDEAAAGDVVLTGAIVPATPIAPGQGPLVDDLGGRWAEQRPAGRTPFWYARTLSATWIPKDGANGFGNTDVPIATSFAPIWFDDLPALLVTPGFGFHFWQPPDDLVLPSTVFDSYVDVTWRTPVSDRWGLAFGITPGVYGDYKAFNSRAFQLTGWGLVDIAVTKTWTLLAGAAVVRQLDMRVLPVGGLVWTPNEANRLELLVPRSRLARRVDLRRLPVRRRHLGDRAARRHDGRRDLERPAGHPRSRVVPQPHGGGRRRSGLRLRPHDLGQRRRGVQSHRRAHAAARGDVLTRPWTTP